MSYRSLIAVTLVGVSSSVALAQLTVSPTSLTFTTQALASTSAKQQVNVTNSGSAAVSFTSITVTGSFSVSSTTCSIKNGLAAAGTTGDSCYVRVGFTPTAAGQTTGTLTFVDSASGSPQKVTLTGTGAAGGLSPASINFGTQLLSTTSAATAVVLANSASSALSISVAITGDFQIASGNCTAAGSATGTVSANSNCTMNVVFTPTTVIGKQTGTLTVTSSNGTQTVALTGTASAAKLSTSSLAFGTQYLNLPSAVQAVSITNVSSTTSFNVTGISLSRADYSQVSSCIPQGATTGKLLPNATCGIYVTFQPTAAGSRAGTMSITMGGGGGTQSVTLTGTGGGAGIALSPRVAAITNTATVSLTVTPAGTSVTWSADGGTITSTGAGTANYTPPTTDGPYTVTATSASPAASASAVITVTDYPGVLTYHNDNMRDGQNQQEIVLNPSNVNVAQFGKLFSYTVDGQVYAQPLYVPNQNIGGTIHNVLIVATENDSIYAFDADGLITNPLWKHNFGTPVPSNLINAGYNDLSPQIGITGTPVIDASAETVFVVSDTYDNGTTPTQRLHAIDIASGNEQPGSPVVITATSQPTIDQATGKPVKKTFQALLENQRAALLLLNGAVYIAWGSFGDIGTYHGWVIGYNETTLAQQGVYITTPVDSYGGIWQSGGGPAADSSGNIYVTSGNGPDDVAAGGSDYSGAFIKLSTAGNSLAEADYFKPNTRTTDNSYEMSSGGPVLLPNQTGSTPHIAIVAGKDKNIYLVNRDNMGETAPPPPGPPPLQIITGAFKAGVFSTPSFWQNNVYFWAETDILRSYQLQNSLLVPTETYPLLMSYPGASTSVSSDSSQNGILWALDAKGVLHAFDATNISHEFYNSSEAGTRDTVPGNTPVKFAVPTVANGKVYVGSANCSPSPSSCNQVSGNVSGYVSGYGLLP
jgi:hypothetical protein